MKAYIVAEIGSNWEGNLSIAKKIIRECKRAGADAVKFQMKISIIFDIMKPTQVTHSSKIVLLVPIICTLNELITKEEGLNTRAATQDVSCVQWIFVFKKPFLVVRIRMNLSYVITVFSKILTKISKRS